MRKIKILSLLAVVTTLASCGANPSSNSMTPTTPSTPSNNSSQTTKPTSEKPEKKHMSISDVYNYVYDLASREYLASHEDVKTTSVNSYSSKVKSISLDIYNDKTSYGTGTVVETNNSTSEVSKEDTFKYRAKSQKEKVKIEDSIKELNFLYMVESYENDSFYTSGFSDALGRLAVVKNTNEATDLGLATGQYILEKNLDTYVTSNAVNSVYKFIDENIVNNESLKTSSLSFEYYDDKDGNTIYSFSTEYKYDNSDVDVSTGTVVDIDVLFTVNNDENMTSFKTSYKVVEGDTSGDSSLAYIKNDIYEGTITYGEKQAPSTKAIDVNNYFINDVTDIDVFDKNTNQPTALNKDQIPASTTAIYAKPKTYSPATALDADFSYLIPKSSSNTSYATVNSAGNGFNLKNAKGQTITLTYECNYKNESGVWDSKDISVTITISKYDDAESIKFSEIKSSDQSPTKEDSYINELIIGKTYTLDKSKVSVNPSSADQEVTITSSDPSIIKAEKNADGVYVLTPLKEGSITLTIASVRNPEIKREVTLKAYTPMAASEISTYFMGKTFEYVSSYGYTNVIKFNSTKKSGTISGTGSSGVTKFNWESTKAGYISLYDCVPDGNDDYEDIEGNFGYSKSFIVTADKNLYVERPNYLDMHYFVLKV